MRVKQKKQTGSWGYIDISSDADEVIMISTQLDTGQSLATSPLQLIIDEKALCGGRKKLDLSRWVPWLQSRQLSPHSLH